jgi:hypothetical protein
VHFAEAEEEDSEIDDVDPDVQIVEEENNEAAAAADPAQKKTKINWKLTFCVIIIIVLILFVIVLLYKLNNAEQKSSEGRVLRSKIKPVYKRRKPPAAPPTAAIDAEAASQQELMGLAKRKYKPTLESKLEPVDEVEQSEDEPDVPEPAEIAPEASEVIDRAQAVQGVSEPATEDQEQRSILRRRNEEVEQWQNDDAEESWQSMPSGDEESGEDAE